MGYSTTESPIDIQNFLQAIIISRAAHKVIEFVSSKTVSMIKRRYIVLLNSLIFIYFRGNRKYSPQLRKVCTSFIQTRLNHSTYYCMIQPGAMEEIQVPSIWSSLLIDSPRQSMRLLKSHYSLIYT